MYVADVQALLGAATRVETSHNCQHGRILCRAFALRGKRRADRLELREQPLPFLLHGRKALALK